jgi:DNA topoisomerase-3
MKAICEGRKTKTEVVQESLEQYREVFVKTQQDIRVLKIAITRYFVDE